MCFLSNTKFKRHKLLCTTCVVEEGRHCYIMMMRCSVLANPCRSARTWSSAFKTSRGFPRTFWSSCNSTKSTSSSERGDGVENGGRRQGGIRHYWLHSPTTQSSLAFPTSSPLLQGHHHHQRRCWHSTHHVAFAPFLPEIIVGVGLGAGWVVYRKTQGKPLTPDQAMASQAAYQKMEQDLQQRNAKYHQQQQAATSSRQGAAAGADNSAR